MDRLDQPNENNSRITQVQKYGFVLPKKVKQFLLQLWHPSCYTYQQSGGNSWMITDGCHCEYDKHILEIYILMCVIKLNDYKMTIPVIEL